MMNAKSPKRWRFGALLLSALLLVGCQSSYVEIPDGNSWDTLGYQTNGFSSGTPEQTSSGDDPGTSADSAPSGGTSYTSLVLSPDGTPDSTTAADPDVTVSPEVRTDPLITTDSSSTTDPVVTTDLPITVPSITTQPTVTTSPAATQPQTTTAPTATEPQTTTSPTTTLPHTTTPPITTEPQTTSAPETAVPGNPGESLTVLELTQTVSKGNQATVTICGLPNTEYTIKVRYSSGYSTAKGLEAKISDENGICSWSWKVGGSTKPGDYPITISDGVNSYSLTFTVQ